MLRSQIEPRQGSRCGRDRLATLDKELAASPATDETPPLAMARRTLAQASAKTSNRKLLSAGECELGLRSDTELLPVERDPGRRQRRAVETGGQTAWEAADLRRKQETEQQLRRAQEEADRLHRRQ